MRWEKLYYFLDFKYLEPIKVEKIDRGVTENPAHKAGIIFWQELLVTNFYK